MRSTPLVSSTTKNRKDKTFIPIQYPDEEKIIITPDQPPPPPKVIKKEEEEEEEKVDPKVLEYQQKIAQIKALATKLRRDCGRYQEEVDVYHTKLTNLKFDYERIQARKMTIWWYITILALTLLKYHSYAHRNMFGLIICEMSFIYNFRLLYVANSQHATIFAWIAILITVFYV
jgi:hypothetical protein